MSWWLAVPLAVLIVLGSGVIVIALCAGAFWLLDRIRERMSERAETATSIVFGLTILLGGFATMVYAVARWLAV